MSSLPSRRCLIAPMFLAVSWAATIFANPYHYLSIEAFREYLSQSIVSDFNREEFLAKKDLDPNLPMFSPNGAFKHKTLFSYAIERNFWDIVSAMIEKGDETLRVNDMVYIGDNAQLTIPYYLAFAAHNQFIELVKKYRNVNLNQGFFEKDGAPGESTLSYTIRTGNQNYFDAVFAANEDNLAQNKISIDWSRTHKGFTPLAEIIMKGYRELLLRVIKDYHDAEGFDVNWISPHLVDHSVSDDGFSQSIFSRVVQLGWNEAAEQILVSCKPNVLLPSGKDDQFSALGVARARQDMKLVQLMQETLVDKNAPYRDVATRVYDNYELFGVSQQYQDEAGINEVLKPSFQLVFASAPQKSEHIEIIMNALRDKYPTIDLLEQNASKIVYGLAIKIREQQDPRFEFELIKQLLDALQ